MHSAWRYDLMILMTPSDLLLGGFAMIVKENGQATFGRGQYLQSI
jgi:hypothetical protein